MKVLLINGSPKGKNSNTLKLANKFVEGLVEERQGAGEDVVVDVLDVSSLNIGACRGCFCCWKSTPGKCVIRDDMPSVLQKQKDADVIVWSFPLYYFNVPGSLKNLIDRQLPMSLPFMSDDSNSTGSGSHPTRYDMGGKRYVLVSTCGFYSASKNYDSVTEMFGHFLGKDNFETIFCGQGELFRVKELSGRTDQYLEVVKKAGREFAGGTISGETHAQLEELLYPRDQFEKMADASWGVDRETGEKESEDLIFTRQMATLYNKNAWDGKDRVLEMNYTDLGKSYQILLNRDGSKVETDGSLEPTTTISTPFDVWVSISQGKIGGAEALGKKLYTVNGDFSLMMNWNKFFGQSEESRTKQDDSSGQNSDAREKKPSMTTLLIPWITFWVAVSINPGVGSVITMSVCALVPLLMWSCKLVIWDVLSIALVAVMAAVANLWGHAELVTNAGYLVFGLLWLFSCLTKEPLCASYIKHNYGGEAAHKNLLFMKTNYILAFAWGILYVLTAVWTFFLNRAGMGKSLVVVNNVIPLAMGVFTAWFSKWYPAHMASGK
ncbi:MAG: NAD(P)H-dependent oxidoreductase [Treponema sp.]|nr:NAD(P)H-dependent oxidoreductase [Treponema sp.]